MTTLATVTRRGLLAGAVSALAPLAAGCTVSGLAPAPAKPTAAATLAGFERRSGVRLGAYARDTGTGAQVSYRANELFPMCSLYKVLAAAAVLGRGKPTAASEHAAEAAVKNSDNAAGNLLLQELGGPVGVTRYARSLGDHVTRLDRTEPTLNEALPHDPRDTTSPRAIATDYEMLVLGGAVSPGTRSLIAEWLKGSTTGAGRIRAAVPASWTVGDKTGTGAFGTGNDAAIVWPPQRAPIVLAVMSTHSTRGASPDNALMAATAKTVLSALGVL